MLQVHDAAYRMFLASIARAANEQGAAGTGTRAGEKIPVQIGQRQLF